VVICSESVFVLIGRGAIRRRSTMVRQARGTVVIRLMKIHCSYPQGMNAILVASVLVALPGHGGAPDVVVVDRDNVTIDRSCTVEIHAEFIDDADGNGVIHIVADDVTVEFSDVRETREMIQVPEGTPWDTIEGIGIRIDGRKNVTLRNAHSHRFKVGIYASNADGLTLEQCDVSGGFAHRLKSTPEAEDGADWLWPHNNDDNEWMHNYGAGIYVENSNNVTIRDCFARRRQNGIILDNVTDSRMYDNDFSFLSGWGLAMWRSSRNVISRNAFDFCVRGYSHGVYNRGQDSAGILMFEQCSENVIAENSATHGGDGFFGFGGSEALGERWVEGERARLREETGRENVDDLLVYPPGLIDFCLENGNNGNILIWNDFSYAVAHGIEMTFSFDNQFISNRMVEDAICGVWGGYSQGTLIADNHFERCGDGAYGLERGGVNIEHGRDNRIQDNHFIDNRCGVHVWWDPDDHLMVIPWAKANDPRFLEQAKDRIARNARVEPHMLPSIDEFISGNTFSGDETGIHARDCDRVFVVDNQFAGVGAEVDAPGSSIVTEVFHVPAWEEPAVEILGEKRPVGARAHLAGRARIIMTEWGPYDWRGPLLHRVRADTGGGHAYELLGDDDAMEVIVSPGMEVSQEGREILITSTRRGVVQPYAVRAETASGSAAAHGLIVGANWSVTAFPYATDPREDVEAWRSEATRGVHFESPDLTFVFGSSGASQLGTAPEVLERANMPFDRFGTIATTRLVFPPGRWVVRTTSDDGIRVWLDGELVIDDWTWHGPTSHTHEFEVEEARDIPIRVEHFELDGWAVLDVGVELAVPKR